MASGGSWSRLPTPRRNVIIENLRLQQVYNAIYTTSLDIALADTPIGAVRRWFARVVLADRSVIDDPSGPARIRAMLQQLGPTYVKIGQMAASRSDVLSPEWIAELSKLQSEAAPFGYDDVVLIVRKELGAPPEALYATFDPVPFAAASTAQVHQATLHDGTLVAVKVQRPRIQAKTQADLGVMQELASLAERRLATARKVGLRGVVDEFAKGVLKELDYRNEAYHARRLADGMARFPEIHIPIVYDELSGHRVITMEFVNGIKISKADALREAGFDTDRARDRLHPLDHQAGPGRRVLPWRPTPGQHPGQPDLEADHLPRPRARRAAQRPAAGGPAWPHLFDQGGRHPGDRRRPARPW